MYYHKEFCLETTYPASIYHTSLVQGLPTTFAKVNLEVLKPPFLVIVFCCPQLEWTLYGTHTVIAF